MAEKSVPQTFPRRDAAGRVVRLVELLVAAVLGVLVGLVALALIDGVIALLGLATFGSASGWLALILPALLFFDEVRAWRGHGVRFLVAIVGAAVAIGLGLIVSGLTSGLPAMLAGAIGAVVAAIVYSLVWFLGIRWLSGYGVGMG